MKDEKKLLKIRKFKYANTYFKLFYLIISLYIFLMTIKKNHYVLL